MSLHPAPAASPLELKCLLLPPICSENFQLRAPPLRFKATSVDVYICWNNSIASGFSFLYFCFLSFLSVWFCSVSLEGAGHCFSSPASNWPFRLKSSGNWKGNGRGEWKRLWNRISAASNASRLSALICFKLKWKQSKLRMNYVWKMATVEQSPSERRNPGRQTNESEGETRQVRN